MSSITITRLRPADLQEVQVQTAVNAKVSDVIVGLQSGVSTVQAPLNTACSACQVAGVSQGWVSAAYKGMQIKVPCPACRGYLLVNTAGGQLAPPVNPFAAPLSVTRILPADLQEALTGLPAAATLDAMIMALLANANTDNRVLYDCARCNTDGAGSGWVNGQNAKAICPLCNGYQKTALPYMLADGRYVLGTTVTQTQQTS